MRPNVEYDTSLLKKSGIESKTAEPRTFGFGQVAIAVLNRILHPDIQKRDWLLHPEYI